MVKRCNLLLLFLLLSFYISNNVNAAIKPQDFGLFTATNSEDRYWALYNCHYEANRLGTVVDYSGIDSLEIEVPREAKSIIIDGSQDFKGLKLIITNNRKDHYLFVCSKEAKRVDVPQSIIDGDDFRSIRELRSGIKLLLIKDGHPWVENRKGHNYGAERRDVRLLVNGFAQNSTIMPYGSANTSLPVCSYVEADLTPKRISNLTFIRTKASKYKTFLISIANINNIELRNIHCITPEDSIKYGDNIIVVDGSTNVTYRNITIDGMYTLADKYGYGISMNNVWNVKLYNVSGNASQGIICNSNVNQSYLKKCSINRYDTHCYGRDAVMEDCTFTGMYFPIASFYGKITFKRCIFQYSQPVWLRADYNAYVPFDIELYNCTWHPIKGRDAICYTGKLDKTINSRAELRDKCWPSIKIRGLKIYPPDFLEILYIFRVGGEVDLDQPIGYMPFIDIKGLKVYGSDIKLDICNKKIRPQNSPKIRVKQARGSQAAVLTESIN